METGGLSALEIIMLLLAINAVVFLTAYGLIRLWRKKSLDTIGEIGGRIEVYHEQINQIAAFLNEYNRVNQEPYASHLDTLSKEASEIDRHFTQYVKTCGVFEGEIQSLKIGSLLEIFNAPVLWFRRWRGSEELKAESQQIAEQLEGVEKQVQQIENLPWEMAQQCCQAEKDFAELAQTARDLQTKGARGQSLQTVLNQLPVLQRGLDEIPLDYLGDDQQKLFASATLASTARVFEVLNRIRPALNRYLPQVREWNIALEKSTSEYADLKMAGANLRKALAQPIEGLVSASLQERLDQVAQMAAEIGQQLAQPQVEDLKPLAREVTQLRRVIQDTEHQLSRASKQINQLNQSMNDLRLGLNKLSSQTAELEKLPVFPLAWDASGGPRSELGKRLQALGPAQQPRTPQQISQHLKETGAIQQAHKAQAEALPKIAEEHRALVALLESPALKEGAAWLRKSREMLDQVTNYDLRNWPKQDAIQTLPADLEELQHLHERLVPADRATPIKESELSQRLVETQQLVAEHKKLRPRIDSVRARLEKIQAMEREGKEKLTESFKALERVLLLAESNDLLDQIATAEIERLNEENRQAGAELNVREQGEVEKKLQKINAQVEKVNRTLNGWLSGLSAAAVELGGQINGRLIELDSIAKLDEPAVSEARSLLNSEAYLSITSGRGAAPARAEAAPAQGSKLRAVAAKVAERGAKLQRLPQLTDLEATAEIKNKNDLWQRLVAAQQVLEERIAPLLDTYQETAQARNAAHEGLAEVNRRLPERHLWPPNNQTAQSSIDVLRPIEQKWEALKKDPRKVEAAVQELQRLEKQYQNAAEHTRLVLNRAVQDEERIQELEDVISEIKQRWLAQAQANPGNAVVREGVQELMSSADSRVAYIKQQYMRSELSYEQVIRSLQLLNDELFTARVPLDAQNDIGLNETSNGRGTHPAD